MPKQLSIASRDKVRVELYGRSTSGDTAFLELLFSKLNTEMPGVIDFSIDYLDGPRVGPISTCATHGEKMGDIFQLCAQKYHPILDDTFAFFNCTNRYWLDPLESGTRCVKSLGFKYKEIQSCLYNGEGSDLRRASIARSAARILPQDRCATILFINGAVYRGNFAFPEVANKICSHLSGDVPTLCKRPFRPTSVEVIAVIERKKINDARRLVDKIAKSMFLNLIPRIVTVESKEGALLQSKHGLTRFPVFLFDSKVKHEMSYPLFAARLIQSADMLKLERGGGGLLAFKEICENNLDDDDDGAIDCDDTQCVHRKVCKQEQINRIDYFTMPLAPLCNWSLSQVAPLLQKSKNNPIDLHIHYMGSVGLGELLTYNGVPEIQAARRQLCVQKLYPERNPKTNYPQYLNYILCRSSGHPTEDWKECVSDSMDVKAIEACATDSDSLVALAHEYKYSTDYGAKGCPHWVINNKYPNRKQSLSKLHPAFRRAKRFTTDVLEHAFCLWNPRSVVCKD